MDGLCIWYNTDGSKKEEFTYENGIKKNSQPFIIGKEKKIFGRNIYNDKLKPDWVYYGNDYNSYYKTALQSNSNGEFEKAVTYFLKQNSWL